MTEYEATEQAYKNGYATGYKMGVAEFAAKLEEKIGFTDTIVDVHEYISTLIKEMKGEG